MNKVNLPGMCGELASDPVATMISVGPWSRRILHDGVLRFLLLKIFCVLFPKQKCEEVANKALTMDTAEEITEYAKSVLAEKGLL